MGRNRRNEINEAEADLARRKLAVASRGARLGDALHHKLTEPAAFIIAGSVGFLAGEFSHRPHTDSEQPPESSGSKGKPLDTASFWLKTALALFSWSRAMLASSEQTGPPDEQ